MELLTLSNAVLSTLSQEYNVRPEVNGEPVDYVAAYPGGFTLQLQMSPVDVTVGELHAFVDEWQCMLIRLFREVTMSHVNRLHADIILFEADLTRVDEASYELAIDNT